MPEGRITVFGGTGFLGRRIAERLAAGAAVRVAVRRPGGAADAVAADVRDRDSVAAAVTGADAVVNAVSAYVESRGVTFADVHERGAETVARAAAAAGATRLVHVSGIGADPQSRSAYIRARGRGEALVRDAFPAATIVRPSALFGPGDALFTTLAGLARSLPALPLIGGGRTRLQPVYVDDAAEAVARALDDPAAAGTIFELGGPRVYTLRELTAFVLARTGRRRPLVPIPFAVARLQAALFELLPSPPLTTGQVELLEADNVVSGAHPGFAELGIAPRAVEDVVSAYIAGG